MYIPFTVNFSSDLHYNAIKHVVYVRPISFPEPTCLLVSAKTWSSGIINFQTPRFLEFHITAHACLGLKHGNLVLRAHMSFGQQPKDTWALGTRLMQDNFAGLSLIF